VSDEPVFIVGCGRSGTTLLYEVLARHRDAAWISTWTDRTGRAELAALNGLFKRDLNSRRFGPRPSEAYRSWDAAVPLSPAAREGELRAEAATTDVSLRIERLIGRHCRFGRAAVFVNKNTRNSRRVGFLGAVCPGAKFVHVLRAPLDTVSSILRARWWRGLPLWWAEGGTPSTLADGPVTEARLGAELWVREVSAVLDARRELAEGRYTEVRYEDLVRSPIRAITELSGRLALDQEGFRADRLARGVSRASVGAHRHRLSPQQADAAWAVARKLAIRVGYTAPG
jgi:hypothetical protein